MIIEGPDYLPTEKFDIESADELKALGSEIVSTVVTEEHLNHAEDYYCQVSSIGRNLVKRRSWFKGCGDLSSVVNEICNGRR